MLSNPLIAYANNYNLTISDDLAYGDIDGYLVSVYNEGAKKCAFVNCCFANSDSDDGKDGIKVFEFSKELSSLAENTPALKNYRIEKNGVTVATTENLTLFDEGVNALLELLCSFEIQGTTVCTNCGNTLAGKSAYIVADNKADLLCGDCFADGYKDTAETADGKTKKSTLRGSIFATFGALLAVVAILASFFVFVPTEDILGMSPLAICIPALAAMTVVSFLFYRISTKAKGNERILPCLIISTLFTSVTVYLSTSILYAKAFGITTIGNASKVMGILLRAPARDPYYRADLLAYFFYSMVAVIVVVLLYSIIFEEKKKPSIKIIPYCQNNNEENETQEDCEIADTAEGDAVND